MVPDPPTDWFGNPLPPRHGGPRQQVPCPLCQEPFAERDDLAAHLAANHRAALRTGRAGRGRGRRWARSLGFLPLWYVLPLTAALVAVVYLAVARIDPWLARYAAALATFPLVLVLYDRVFNRRNG